MAENRYRLFSSLLLSVHSAAAPSGTAPTSPQSEATSHQSIDESSLRSQTDVSVGVTGTETSRSDSEIVEESDGLSSESMHKTESDTSVESDIAKMVVAFGEQLSVSKGTSVLGTDLSFANVAKAIREKKFNRIVVLSGAGISVAAGIPDFRTKGTGLYDNLQKYNLPYPEAIFELDFFEENPKPFCVLAKELFPGSFDPTPAHYLVRLLHDKGMLLRNFTQNIDTLERRAGIPAQKLVEAHGSFAEASCLYCNESYPLDHVRTAVFADDIPMCKKKNCRGFVKPNIVFFGESLPNRFWKLRDTDLPKADLLIIMGTSLKVQPFCRLINDVQPTCPRVLINRERVGVFDGGILGMTQGYQAGGLMLGTRANTRDVEYLGDIQEGIKELVSAIGWEKELEALLQGEKCKL